MGVGQIGSEQNIRKESQFAIVNETVKITKMIFLNILLYVIGPLIFIAYWFMKKTYSYFEDRGIAFIKPAWFYGNMDGVGKTTHLAHVMRNLYEKCKGKDVIAGFYSFMSPAIVITDLELAKQITVKEFNRFLDRGFYVNEKHDILTSNLVATDGDRWKFMRNKMSPAFTTGKIKMICSTISDKSDDLMRAIETASKSGSVDLREWTIRFTIDILSSSVLGLESNTLENNHPEFVRIFRKVFGEEGGSMYFQFVLTYPNFARFLKWRQFEDRIEHFFSGIIKGSINHREENNVVRNDFLNMLMQLKNKGLIEGDTSTDTTRLTMNEVIAQAFVFFLGGVDNSSSVISFAIAEMSHHPEVQDKLRKEIEEKSQGGITYDNLNEMTYLHQIVSGKNLNLNNKIVFCAILFFRNATQISSWFRPFPTRNKRL